MNLHEYQAKDLLKQYQLPVGTGILATTPEEAVQAFETLGGESAVIKVQVHAGGRGKGGGVKVVHNAQEAQDFTQKLLGSNLVTFQTDHNGQPVHAVLVCEDIYPVAKELYLGLVVDRASCRVTFIVSSEGGMDIEEVAAKTPEKIVKIAIDPLIGVQAFQGREAAAAFGLQGKQISAITQLMKNAYKMFVENDCSLFEVNPLAILNDGSINCVDAKICLDDNALFRNSALAALRDTTQENEREVEASEFGLSYVTLEGNIGCMVNGAGLAMATMDMIKFYGGQPANFLDVGGAADQQRVVEAFKLILADKSVKGVLINIFGGIVRCDMIAEAIIAAVKEVEIAVPVVVRLEGNQADKGAKLLAESGLALIPAQGLANAAQQIIAAVEGVGKSANKNTKKGAKK